MNRFSFIFIIFLTAVALAFVSCNSTVVYDHYANVSLRGWERSDTLSFDVGRIAMSGDYAAEVGVRVGSGYPYTRLCLVVNRSVRPSGKHRCDTLMFDLIDGNGAHRGGGIGIFQYARQLPAMALAAGDTLRVSVTHGMNREVIEGVADVGFKLEGGD